MIYNSIQSKANGDIPIMEPDDIKAAAQQVEEVHSSDGAAVLAGMSSGHAAEVAEYLDPKTAADAIVEMPPALAASVLVDMEPPEAAMILAAMRPDDRVDVLAYVPRTARERMIGELDAADQSEVRRLVQYPSDTAGGIMTTQVAALYEHITVENAISLLRKLSQELEQIIYVYVINRTGQLLGVLSMRDLILAAPDTPLSRIMHTDVVSVPATMDQEHVAHIMRQRDFLALPVVDGGNRLIGIITVDDIVDVAAEEATEDIQKLGGSEALDAPYLDVGFFSMLRKRGGWLSVLFLGEMLTATAMGYFQHEIEQAVVLALFVPLIISSGGNSGSQAATIVVRSLALSELKLRDWWRVFGREIGTSFTLGAWLGMIGFVRVTLWQHLHWIDYGPHYLLVALTVWISLIGVVTFGSLAGSMLPFLLRRAGFDPATSSAPFVATLVDVTGLIIYFTVALLILHGTLL
jgi:magnesium transporter